MVVVWCGNEVCNVILGLNCQYFQDPNINIMITIGTIVQFVSPFIIFKLRFSDPSVKKKFINKIS